MFKSKYDAKFPKVNYIGNKEKIASWIVEELPIKEGAVLDLFSGGSSISYELKKQGFKVISNDILYSSYVVAKSLIENTSVVLMEEHIDKANNIVLSKEDIQKFSWLINNLYFSEEVEELARLSKYSLNLDYYEKYMFQSLIRRAMIRKLPYSRMNLNWDNIVKLRNEDYSYEKYGRKRAYHNESFSNHMRKNLADYNMAVFDNKQKNKCYQLDALDMLDQIDYIDAIYIDPPYPNTMNKYDDFYGVFDELFNKKKTHINLTNKDDFVYNLESIISKASSKTSYIILSLNSNSKPNIEEMKNMIEYYGTLTIKEKKHNYQVSGKINKNTNYEQLAILKYK